MNKLNKSSKLSKHKKDIIFVLFLFFWTFSLYLVSVGNFIGVVTSLILMNILILGITVSLGEMEQKINKLIEQDNCERNN